MANAADTAYDFIRKEIAAGRFAPGSRLPEQDIAEAAGVSRTPVREALRRLNAEGLVSMLPNQGVRVVSFSYEDVREVFALRALLEPHVVRRAAERISADDIKELKRLAGEFNRLAQEAPDRDYDVLGDLNRAFHGLILDATGSERLHSFFKGLMNVPLTIRMFAQYTPDDLRQSAAHHVEIARALELGDGEWAASVMKSHIHSAWKAIEHTVKETNAPPL